MKKLLAIVTLIILAFTVVAFSACSRKPKEDVDVDEDGNIVDNGKIANVDFWGWGDPDEVEVFRKLTDQFNAANPRIIVNYVQKPSEGYSSTTAQALQGRHAPDVFYVGDGDLKQWASLDLMEPLDDYLSKSKEIKQEDIWDSAMQRYRYDKQTQQSRPSDPLFAVPKDIGPTVIYYNKNAFAQVGVQIITVDEADIDTYNAKHGTSYRKSGYYELDESGAPVDPNSASHGVTKIFNNRIAMTWEENVKLSKLLTKSYNSASPTDYGYFTEWWFNYGWSVGGDCIEYNQELGNWEFSLGDTVQNKNEDGELMPSMREAFTHFLTLSQPKDVDVDGNGTMGLAITPTPDTLSTVGKSGYFTSGRVAMMVDGRWSTVTYRKNIKDFDWDVAPLPKAATGVEAGHSGSMGMGIWSKSKVKNAAWKFCEYIAGETGQAAQAKTGFNIPNQKTLANSEVFLQSDQKPSNSVIFLRAAEMQRAGDWTFLPDSSWIEEWAPLLNGDVRNGKMNLTKFFQTVTARSNEALKKYTN